MNVGTELTGIDMVPPEETERLRKEVKSLKRLNAKLQEKLKRRKVRITPKNSRESASSSSEEYTLSELSTMFENVKTRSAKYKLRAEELSEKNKFLEAALKLYIQRHGPLSEIKELYAASHEVGADSSDDGITGMKRYNERTNSESLPKKRRIGVDKSVLSGSSSISSSSISLHCTPSQAGRSFVLKTSPKTPEIVENVNRRTYSNLSKKDITFSNNSTDVEEKLSIGTRMDQKQSSSPVDARSIKIEDVDFSAHFGSHGKPEYKRHISPLNVGGSTHKLQLQGPESGIPHLKAFSSYSGMPAVTLASDEVKPMHSPNANQIQKSSSIVRSNVVENAQESKQRQVSRDSNEPNTTKQGAIPLSQQSDTTCIEETPPKVINLLPRLHPYEQDTSSINRVPISPSMISEYINAHIQYPDETLYTVHQYYERGNGLLSPGSVGLSVLDTLPQYGWQGKVTTPTMLSSQNVATKSKTFDVKQKGKLESEPKMADLLERKSSISRSPVHFNISESIPRDLEEDNYRSNRVRRGSSVDMFDKNSMQSSSNAGSPLDALLERDLADVDKDEHSNSDIDDDAVISQQDFDTFHQHHISQGVRNIYEMKSWLNSQASNTDGLVLGNQEKEYLKVLAMQKSMFKIDELIASDDDDEKMSPDEAETDGLKLDTSDGGTDGREIIDLTGDEPPVRNSKAPQHRNITRRNPISYKYDEVVRNKEARKQMHGITCDVCRKVCNLAKFSDAVKLTMLRTYVNATSSTKPPASTVRNCKIVLIIYPAIELFA
ncbi:hypothetical protein BKA69DRAFT_1091610 [Paraphysoderma sedebokerense]|nr:hypothetical protein BKA69DRAFT_1091610 [Paraphysoderma sedebokerense]